MGPQVSKKIQHLKTKLAMLTSQPLSLFLLHRKRIPENTIKNIDAVFRPPMLLDRDCL